MARCRPVRSPAAALVLAVLALGGCATYGSKLEGGLAHLDHGDYRGAIAAYKHELSPNGPDRLIYHMELGSAYYLAGQYQQSLRQLEQAERLGEELYTKHLGDILVSAMTNPRTAPYTGKAYELNYIPYYKMLDYLELAATDPDHRDKWLDGARVEARRVAIRLDALVAERGNYTEAKGEKGDFFAKVMGVFGKLFGNAHIGADRLYRDDAFLRYMTGVVYELRGEYNNARIAYQQAAQLYENGFAKQYFLGPQVTERAWYDTLRMMKKVGRYGTEIRRLRNKLSAADRKRLATPQGDDGQVVVIQHLARVPERSELNLLLYMPYSSNDLILRPLLGGPRPEREAELGWFYTVYSGHSVFESLYNYRQGKIYGVLDGLFSKRIPTGVFAGQMRQLGLSELMGQGGLRVTVPYYRPPRIGFGASELKVDGSDAGTMITATSLADIAIQQQLADAGDDLRGAIARELVKAKVAAELGRNAGGQAQAVIALFGRFAAIASSAAETRNWLSLPFAIRIERVSLSPGLHTLELDTAGRGGGTYNRSFRQVTVPANGLILWPVRTFRCVGATCGAPAAADAAGTASTQSSTQ